jgi:hypothetical protein
MADGNEPQHVITDNPNVVPTGRELALEAAATLAAMLDLRKERTLANQRFTVQRKQLEKRAEELIDEIRTGPNNQLKLHFGSVVAEARALASSAPADEKDESIPEDQLADVPEDDEFENEEEAETNEALH